MMSSNRRHLGFLSVLSYIAFPPKTILMARLRRIDDDGGAREALYEKIAETLASRTLDSAAFSFLLIELMHRHVESVDEDLAVLLPRCILALTGDRELSEAARAAFDELGQDDGEAGEGGSSAGG